MPGNVHARPIGEIAAQTSRMSDSDPMDSLSPALSYTCPNCHWTSHNPNDAHYRYCGHCHMFEEDAALLRRFMELWAARRRHIAPVWPSTQNQLPPLCTLDLPPCSFVGYHDAQRGIDKNPFPADSTEARQWMEGRNLSISEGTARQPP